MKLALALAQNTPDMFETKKSFIPRPYQQEAIDLGIDFFHDKKKKFNAIEILPTGSGKSVVIANIAMKLEGKTIVFQPSKEILEQNLHKFLSYGYHAGVYSASAGSRTTGKITFATIGSVIKKWHLFRDVKHIIVDECHLVNAKDGASMYNSFFKFIPEAKIMGCTATPYRLTSGFDGAMLKFLTRTSPRIFNKVLYYIQNDVLFNNGYLAKLKYYDETVIDRNKLTMNSTGTDFTEDSIKAHYRAINMVQKTINYANRLLAKRKNLLVFCSLISEANEVSQEIPGSVVLTGEMDMTTRTRILTRFKSGVIKCVINVGVLTTGFDYPELECILMARSTMSLALYYQIFGRGMRPHPDKEDCWLVDLGGNYRFFGKIETMKIRTDAKGLYSIWNNNKQLTNVNFIK